MKRTLAIALMVAFAIGAIGGPVTAAKVEKLDKVDVCHVTGSSDIISGLNKPARKWAFGHIVSVAAAAVDSHLAHGDSLVYRDENDPKWQPGWDNLHESADNDELKISQRADCYFEVIPV